MTNRQAEQLQAYFEEHECDIIETVNFCFTKSDNAILGGLLKNGEIEFLGEDKGRNMYAGEYIITEKGRSEYERLTGERVPE